MNSYTIGCDAQAAPAETGTVYFGQSIPEPTGRTRIVYVGDNDALMLPGRAYRIPFTAEGAPFYSEGGMVLIPTAGESARAYVHKAEVDANGNGMLVMTNLDAPITASQALAAGVPGLEVASFTDIVEFIGDFSPGWVAIGFILGAFFLWSFR